MQNSHRGERGLTHKNGSIENGDTLQPHLPTSSSTQQLRQLPVPDRDPHVSVLITALDAAAYLSEAIDSVLLQGATISWELLVVNDGSGDETGAVASAYAAAYPGRIRVLQHPGGRNRGISASRNLALQQARGTMIALLDADDVWLPGKLERQVRLLESLPGVAMVYAQAERWVDFALPFCPDRGSLGRNTVPPLLPPGEVPGVLEPPRLLEWFLADESLAPCPCTVLLRTAAARRVGGFCNAFRGLYDDQVFYAKLALSERIAVSTDVVARYRQHATSCCAVARETATAPRTRTQFLNWLAHYAAQRSAVLPCTPAWGDALRAPVTPATLQGVG